jgi:sugar phosphate isomerase/epimerase
MIVATSLNLLHDITPDIPGAIGRFAAAGFEGFDFNGIDVVANWVKNDGDRHVGKLKDAVEQHGLRFVQAHGPMFSNYAEELAGSPALTPPCLEWCARLKAPWMVMHPLTVDRSASRSENLAANLSYFRDMLPAMERHGVGVAIENMSDVFGGPRRYGAVPEDLVELCDHLAHPLFGLCWDTGHANLQHLSQRAALGMLGSRLKVLHVQDNDGLQDNHILPYHGNIKWDEVLAGLKAAGYTGEWTFEVHNAVRPLPDALRDEAMRLAVSIGRHLCARFDAQT